jgi:hypothetical protein
MLSVMSCGLNVAGNAARIFTTLVLTRDPLLLGGIVTQGGRGKGGAQEGGRGGLGGQAGMGRWGVVGRRVMHRQSRGCAPARGCGWSMGSWATAPRESLAPTCLPPAAIGAALPLLAHSLVP